MKQRLWTFLLLTLCTLAAPGQDLRLPVPEKSKAIRSSIRAWLRDGRKLAKKGDRAALHTCYLHAHRLHPESPEILEKLLLTVGTDSDRRFWAHRYAAACTLGTGAFKPSTAAAAAFPKEDPHPTRIARAQARAARDLVALVAKLDADRPTTPLVIRWAAVTALELLQHSPALRASFGPPLNARLEPGTPAFPPIVRRLSALQAKAAERGDIEYAIRIAACLNGLDTQARYKCLQGPHPAGYGKRRSRTAEAFRRLRGRKREDPEKLPDLRVLNRMLNAPTIAFNRKHASIGHPAACLSSGGRYRIETTCGLETLLAAANSVEKHHCRLVNWFKQDPFEEKIGLIRIVPTPADLECEGAPRWWDSGFQRGDEITIQIAWSNKGALGRLLTRELTRRFDAAINPAIPTWLAEGRAVWASHAYGPATDTVFWQKHAVFNRMDLARRYGYGSPEKLKKLIEGRLEDHRDYRFAGYALYVYLSGERHAGRLEEFVQHCGKTRGSRFKLFLRDFVDGKDGRSDDFKTFAAAFRDFIRGFRSTGPALWTEKFKKKQHLDTSLIADIPTWINGRVRAAPWFGETHARTAGDLLIEAGEHDLGIAAWCWALTVDEWSPAVVERLAPLFHAQWYREGAWALRSEAHRRFPRAGLSPGPMPFWPQLEGVKKLLEAYRDAVWHYRRIHDPSMAAHLARAHNRLAHRVSQPRLRIPSSEELMVIPTSPAHHVGAHGWVEAGLADHEKPRTSSLWFADPNGDLVLGRSKVRAGAGTADRIVHERLVFVRSREWLPRGRYVIRAVIQPETAYFNSALILGYLRRDRNIRMQFRAGDSIDSAGMNEKIVPRNVIAGVRCRIDGRFHRDGNLPGASPRRTLKFDIPRSAFQLEVVIDGDRVHLSIDSRPVCSYCTPDHSPIEGYVGFASRGGSCRVQFPTVERLDGIPVKRIGRPWPAGLNPVEPQDLTLRDLLNRPTHGLPRREAGTAVLWISPDETGNPAEEADGDRPAKKAALLAAKLADHLRKYEYREPIVLALPDRVSEEAIKKLRKALDSRGAAGVKIIEHSWPARAVAAGAEKSRSSESHLLFIGPDGTLRTVEPYPSESRSLPVLTRRWALICAKEACAR